MARPLTIPPHLSIDELERRYRRAHDPVLRSHCQIVWLLASGHATAQVAAVTGHSEGWVRKVAARHRRGGPDALCDRRHANPGAALALDDAAQADLRAALAGPAPGGGLWTGRQVAAWMAARLGRPVHERRRTEWLRRLGLSPQRPRPRETRADAAVQSAFKNGQSWWRLLPTVSTEAMAAALAAFARDEGIGPGNRAAVVMDNAGWRHARALAVPEGVHPVFPPPWSPELQPAERLWGLVDEPVANRVFPDLDALEETLAARCRELVRRRAEIRSRCRSHWWPEEPARIRS